MIRYLERPQLLSLLRQRTDDPSNVLAESLSKHPALELVTLNQVNSQELLPIYQVRLRRSMAGDGPKVTGLENFVDALRGNEVVEIFSVRAGDTSAVGLLDEAGEVLAVTLIEAPPSIDG